MSASINNTVESVQKSASGSRTKRARLKIEKFLTSDGDELSLYFMHPPSVKYHSILFVPSLIGGSYMQQYEFYKETVAEGYLFVSFSYRGHRSSTGKFCISQCLKDAYDVIKHVKKQYPLPVFAIGACGGSVPLAYCLKQDPEIFDKVALVNSISDLKHVMGKPGSVFTRYKSLFPKCLIKPTLLISAITRDVFPHIDQSTEHFGHLKYKNTKLPRLIWEYFCFDAFRTEQPISCPTFCCVSTKDDILNIDQPKPRSAYKQKIRSIFPNVLFEEFETDHYLNGELSSINQQIHRFFLTP